MENKIITNQKPRKFKNENTERKKKSYNTQAWKNLSRIQKMEKPLCECCKIDDKVSSVEEIHHAIKFDDQENPEVRSMLLLDKDNLISLCKDCHQKYHKNPKELTGLQRNFFHEKQMIVKRKYESQLIFLTIK